MNADRAPGGMTCAEVADLAGAYVLGAVEAAEARRVAAHLAACPEAHAEVAELGGVVPALALMAEPIAAPADLRARVMADYAAANPPANTAAAVAPQRVRLIELGAARQRVARPWLSWAAAAAALLVIAVLGGVALMAQQRADREAQRAVVLAEAIAVMADPGSSVALLRGSGAAAGASGFAAFGDSGRGYVILTGLPDAPVGMAYQAWYLVDGQPFSAGLLSVDIDGYAVLSDINGMPGTDVVALTLEPASGSLLPTSEPVVVGEVRAPT